MRSCLPPRPVSIPSPARAGTVAACALLALLVARTHAQCPIALGPATSTSAGPFQWGVAVGDFNEDGRPDLAFCRSLGNEIIVQLASAAPGSFGPPVAYGVGAAPGSIAAGDFNGDGHLDLATANLQGDNISVLLGVGGPTGAFLPAANYSMGDGPTRLAVGDFNGDMLADLATANDGTNNVSVRLSTGEAGFGALVNYPVGANPSGLAAADFTGDGLIDLASANLVGSVSLLRNTGAGAFATGGTYALPREGFHAVALDANLDGKMDLAVTLSAGGTPGLALLVGNATPTSTFAAPVSYAAGPDAYFVAAGDFNLDARPDLAVTNFGGGVVAILRGNGTTTSTFQAPVTLAAPGNPNGAAIADLNGDARPDLVVSKQGGASFTSAVFFNTGNVPPTITQQPADAFVCPSAAANLAVAASGAGPLTYAWQLETSPGVWQALGNDPAPIPCGGMAFASPIGSPAVMVGVFGCEGPFRVRCVVSNACGSTPSSPASIALKTQDYTHDGNADQDDTAYLVGVVAGGPNPTGENPDLTGDGNVDQSDIAALIDWIAGGACP